MVHRAPPSRRATALEFGSCSNPTIIFADGLDGRNQASFEPANESDFNHGSALGIAVITSFICQQLNDKCKAGAGTITACNDGAKNAAALTGQAAADAFNQALGFSSATTSATTTAAAGATTTTADVAATTTADCFRTVTVMATVTSTPAAVLVAATSTTDASVCLPTTVTSTVTVTADSSSTTTSTNTALNFRTCTDPSVIFAFGLDGRKATEASFEPHDLTQFNHNTALNSAIIYQFQCDNLVNNCGLKQTDATVTACRAAQTQALAVGNNGAGADEFNKLLGFSTNFAALDANLTTTAAKRSEGAFLRPSKLQKLRRDPKLALKEASRMAKERGLSAARNVRVTDWE